MLSINDILKNKEDFIKKLSKKNFQSEWLFNEIENLDSERKITQKKLDDTLSEANKIAREIGELFKQGLSEKANQLKSKTLELKSLSKDLSEKLAFIEDQLRKKIIEIPNIPHDLVKPGKSAEDNETIRTGGKDISFYPVSKAHWEIPNVFRIIDFESGTKLTGAGFPVYKGAGAKLQRALISFFLDEAIKNGYTEYEPPFIVNEDSAFGTGQLPDKDSQMYHISLDNFYLVPTAEVPLTNLFRDNILELNELPVKLTAYTPCFRREAGSYGKDVRGLNRVHQFDKVEIVQIVHPEKSYEVLDEMVSYVESLVSKLGLTYRIVRLCGGDMSFTSSMTYDFEVYSSGQKRWLEVSSVSNFESFQAVRLKLRFRDEDKKNRFVHTLNGSALALPRIVSSILENYQNGNIIEIPEALWPYTAFKTIDLSLQ